MTLLSQHFSLFHFESLAKTPVTLCFKPSIKNSAHVIRHFIKTHTIWSQKYDYNDDKYNYDIIHVIKSLN